MQQKSEGLPVTFYSGPFSNRKESTMKRNHLVMNLLNSIARPAINRIVRTAVTMVLAVAVTFGCGGVPATTPPPAPPLSLPADAKELCIVPASEFTTWFESGSVTLDGVVKPADSVNFSDIPNCDFYKWSEQMFLWLTSPAPISYGGGGGRIFASPAFFDVSPLDASEDRTLIPHEADKPLFLQLRNAQVGPHNLQLVQDEAGRMLEIAPPEIAESGNQLVLNEAGQQVEIERASIGENGQPIFFDETGKAIPEPRPIIPPDLNENETIQLFMIDQHPIFLNFSGNVVNVELGQALGGQTLMAQNGSLVYYATMVNDVFAYFVTGIRNGDIPSPGGNIGNAKFPTTQTELDAIIAFAIANGKPSPNPFPDPEALAVEVKTSWVEADKLSDPSRYITMQATIPTYDVTNPNEWIPNGQKTVKLAMVGIHVVGSTKGHPELIWASFEHINNTPTEQFSYVNNSNVTISVPRSTAGDWLFCANNSSGPFNQPHMGLDGSSPSHIVAIPGFTISPSDTVRSKAWGGASNQTPNPLVSIAESNTEIISINNSVRSQLVSGDVRSNYMMIGSTWTIGGSAPTGHFPLGNEVGTSMSSNSTMETYQQGTDSLVSSGMNCFGCHGAAGATNTVRVSHMFCTPFDPNCPHGLKPLFPP